MTRNLSTSLEVGHLRPQPAENYMTIARQDSWQTEPMPKANRVLAYSAKFTSKQFERISQGLIPESMDDRWLVYMEDDVLHIHRSWTGFCIYQVRFQERGGRHFVGEALANRDPAQYGEPDQVFDAKWDDYNAKHLDWLIRCLLLGQRRRLPRHPDDRPWWRFW